MKKPMALILQGGGALGAFEHGVIAALIDDGWYPKAVTGVSIGAINAAAIAGARGGDILASLDGVWKAISLPTVPWLPVNLQGNLSLLGNPNFWLSRTDYFNLPVWNSLCTTVPMRATLATHLDFDQLNNPEHMRFGITATNLHTGALTTFSNYTADEAHLDSGQHKAVRARLTPAHIVASGSLPPGFPATRIDGTDYWDGGLFNNTPIDSLLNLLKPDEIASLPIFTIDLFPTEGQPSPANLQDVQTRATALQYQNRFWAEYGGTAKLEGFVDMLGKLEKLAANSELEGLPAFDWLMRLRALKNLHVIQSVPFATGSDHDFSAYGVRSRYEAGRASAEQYLAQLSHHPRLRAAA